MKPERQPDADDRRPDAAPAPEPDAGRTPLDWPRRTGRVERVMAAITVRQRRRQRRQFVGGGAAALAVAAGAWLFLAPDPADSGGSISRAPVVVLPERRTLPDGTLVELKAGSELGVDFGGALRRVALRGGHAHFQVARDAARAFVVEAGGVEFRAVGTAFAVELGEGEVEMLVTEGRVAVGRVTAAAPAAAPTELVEAGSRAVVDLTLPAAAALPRITTLSPAESGEKLAWRVPRLELSDTPLAEAIAAINRHVTVPLALGDATLGRVGISGVLRADNIEPLLRMLESNYGIRADRREPGRILLCRSP